LPRTWHWEMIWIGYQKEYSAAVGGLRVTLAKDSEYHENSRETPEDLLVNPGNFM